MNTYLMKKHISTYITCSMIIYVRCKALVHDPLYNLTLSLYCIQTKYRRYSQCLLYSSRPRCRPSGVRIIHFFFSQILRFHQYSVSMIHFYHPILQDSIGRYPGIDVAVEGLGTLSTASLTAQ